MTTKFSDHLLTGDHASRPAATAVPDGTLYACTDHTIVYQSDGATWSNWHDGSGGSTTFSGARVYHSVAQTLGDNSFTALNFDSESFDTDGYHDTVTNNTRLTVPAGLGGTFRIHGVWIFDGHTNISRVSSRILLNGTTQISFDQAHPAGGGHDLTVPTTTMYELAAGDYVELTARQDNTASASVDTLPSGVSSPLFEIERLGD